MYICMNYWYTYICTYMYICMYACLYIYMYIYQYMGGGAQEWYMGGVFNMYIYTPV